MRKSVKKSILGFVIGGLFALPTTYLITKASIDSRLINYSNSNTTQYGATKENVQEAIDELYAKGQAKLATVQANSNKHIYANGEIVYFDPVNNTKCTTWTENNSATNNKTGCLRWFAYLDDGSDTVKLLLDHNTTATVQWYTSSSYVTYANSRAKQEIDNLISTSGSNWKVSSSDSSIAIKSIGFIDANDIARITGKTTSSSTWDSSLSSNYFYFGGMYWWLYDRTYNCTSYGCRVEDMNSYTNASSGQIGTYNYGYWTSTNVGSSGSYVWNVNFDAYLGTYDRNAATYLNRGVRPVITILRSKL